MITKTYHTIIANKKITAEKLARATDIISDLYDELPKYIAHGHGPFLAAIYDSRGKLIAKSANSVVSTRCSHNHAEMNAIAAAESALGTHDLSSHNLEIYVTAEPCMMCIGAIMWSGIRAVYYGVSSHAVESITGFDEGFKTDWHNEFKKRGITVCGHIAAGTGEKILTDYVNQNHIIYKPARK